MPEPAPKKPAPPCPKCGGEGQLWRYTERGGFEYDHRWDRCEACDGTGYEPKEEDDADSDLEG